MARDQDRQFSEGGSLNLDGESTGLPEGEERLPAWAVRNAEAETRNGAEASRSAQADASGGMDAQDFDSHAEADQAWAREARRAENAQSPAGEQDGADGASFRQPAARRSGKDGGGKKNASPKDGGKKKKNQDDERRGFLRTITIVIVCVVLFGMTAVMILSNFVSSPLLALPRRIVTSVITPVQQVFSSVTDSVADYLRKLKIRGNIEYEYDQLLIKYDEQANDVAIIEELRRTIESLYDVLDEQKIHRDLNPLFAEVIGTDSSNYFSTLTLNVGSRSGVKPNMAVVAQGGLVGVTYDVDENRCKVSCIINSDCTVAGLVQSSRDQGSVKGTLGTNGEAMCRMYYLPETSLPRPGDVVVTSGVGLEFPKGIPIGYIRESTRGMEDNKSYVVLEPIVDFQHLEYVTVYRYVPLYAEEAQNRTTTSGTLKLEPLETAAPIPTWQLSGQSDFLFSVSPTPETPQETPAPTQEPTPEPTPTATPDPNATPVPPNLEYVPSSLDGSTPTPSPRPTMTPTPSPVPTSDPGAMTVEDDE